MPTGGARRGRRDNGLVATEYAVVGDVDPRVGEHLLDVLALAGIAAYLQPASDLHPITRTSTLPPRPTDRLYADRAHLQAARGYLSQLAADAPGGTVPGLPGRSGAVSNGSAPGGAAPGSSGPAESGSPSPAPGSPESTGGPAGPIGDGTADPPAGRNIPDIDAAWATIVAGFSVTVDPTTAPWPAAEEVPPARGTSDAEPDVAPRFKRLSSEFGPRVDADDEPSLLDALDTFGTFDGSDDEDEDEGYRPPPPPPLPRISSTAVAGLIAIVAGVVLLFWPDLLPIDVKLTWFLAFSALLGGFVTLIWRLRPGDDPDEDPDDGARV